MPRKRKQLKHIVKLGDAKRALTNAISANNSTESNPNDSSEEENQSDDYLMIEDTSFSSEELENVFLNVIR